MKTLTVWCFVLCLALGCATTGAQETGAASTNIENPSPEALSNDGNKKTAKSVPMAAPTANNEAMIAYNEGTRLMNENRLDEAETYLKEAVRLDPLFVDAMDHLGLVYRKQNRFPEAEAMYLQSIAANKNNTVPYQNLAVLYRLQNRLNEALELYKKMREIDPENPESYYGIGLLFYIVDDHEKSIVFFNEAIKKYMVKNSAYVYDAYYYQGLNYYYLEKYDEALIFLDAAQKGDPDNKAIAEKIDDIQRKKP
jgi:tetratricopeptide (TPR) repeat protein